LSVIAKVIQQPVWTSKSFPEFTLKIKWMSKSNSEFASTGESFKGYIF
jgi:hypothetical protein